jgi:two-component system CheB/CheR fusion protein
MSLQESPAFPIAPAPRAAPRLDAEAEHLLRLALAQEEDHALVVLDAHGRVVEWLAGAARIFGYECDEMMGHPLDRLFTPEDAARGEGDRALRAARTYGKVDEDRMLVRKDGLRIWVSGVTTALRDRDGGLAGFVAVARDRSDMRGHLGALQQRIEELSRRAGSPPAVLGTLAHELRNPLGQIANANHVMAMLGGGQERLAACSAVIERQVRYVEGLVRDLLETTCQAAGKSRLHCETVDLRAIVDSAIETCSVALEARSQTVEISMPQPLPIKADPVRMQQVLVNLIGNSSKFSPPGAGIWIKAHTEGSDLVLRVEDHGKGIAAELLPGIFQIFAQAGEHGDAPSGGLGLGLGVVKSIVQLHGGSVQARSDGPGAGAEFIVRIPCS